MKTAEEYYQYRNGGKSSKKATEDGELITPIYAVELMRDFMNINKKKPNNDPWTCDDCGNSVFNCKCD